MCLNLAGHVDMIPLAALLLCHSLIHSTLIMSTAGQSILAPFPFPGQYHASTSRVFIQANVPLMHSHNALQAGSDHSCWLWFEALVWQGNLGFRFWVARFHIVPQRSLEAHSHLSESHEWWHFLLFSGILMWGKTPFDVNALQGERLAVFGRETSRMIDFCGWGLDCIDARWEAGLNTIAPPQPVPYWSHLVLNARKSISNPLLV